MQNLLKKTPHSENAEPQPVTVPNPDYIQQKYVRPVKQIEQQKRHTKLHSQQEKKHSVEVNPYLMRLPTLLLSFVGYGATFFILTHIPPEQVQSFLLPNTYLPLLLALGEGHFFFFSYVFMKTRRGLLLTLLLTALLFLQLHTLLSLSLAGIVIGFFALIEVCLVL